MNDGELRCNVRGCYETINSVAWATFCSHLFCEQHGNQHFAKVPNTCFACGACLGKGDIVKLDLDPSEQFRNMALAGLKPEVLMDICSRGLQFWTYQMEKDKQRQTQKVDQMKSQMLELEIHYEKKLRDNSTEIANLNRRLQSSRKEVTNVLEQKESIATKLAEKNMQHNKMKSLYNSLRRRVALSPPYQAGPVLPAQQVPRPLCPSAAPFHVQYGAAPAPSSYSAAQRVPPSAPDVPTSFDSARSEGNKGASTYTAAEISFSRTRNFEFFPVLSSANPANGELQRAQRKGDPQAPPQRR